MEETAVVGDLGFDVLCGVTPAPHLVEVEIGQSLQVLGLEHHIDAAAVVGHVDRLVPHPIPRTDP
jgi:hypothetical protein